MAPPKGEMLAMGVMAIRTSWSKKLQMNSLPPWKSALNSLESSWAAIQQKPTLVECFTVKKCSDIYIGKPVHHGMPRKLLLQLGREEKLEEAVLK